MTDSSSRKILYVIGSLDLGGTERHLALISPRLKRAGWEPTIYCISRRGIQSDAVERSGVNVIGPPWESDPAQGKFTKIPRLVASCVKLIGQLVLRRPHIVHFFLPLAYSIGAPLALFARSPLLIMSRRSLNYYQKQHPLVSRLEHWLHRRMDAILANSRAVADQLINSEGCEPDNVSIIYNGVAVDEISRAEPAPADVAVRPADLVLIIVANLIPYKGHSDLFDALGAIRGQLPKEWKLLCIGRDDGIRQQLEERAHDLKLDNHIYFLGERTDVASILKIAHVGILCSREEGFSNAILEGMAAGLPMVVTDVGGNAEAVVDQQTGIVVPPHDSSALGAAIVTLASSRELRDRMGKAARDRAENHFSLNRCVERYDAFYRGLMQRHRGATHEDGSGAQKN